LLFIFQASEELEDRESLAVMAASGLEEDVACTGDGETFIEKYTRGVSAVETILTLDRLRQSVAVKELGRDSPNFSQTFLKLFLNYS
jgi:kinesin family protein 13